MNNIADENQAAFNSLSARFLKRSSIPLPIEEKYKYLSYSFFSDETSSLGNVGFMLLFYH